MVLISRWSWPKSRELNGGIMSQYLVAYYVANTAIEDEAIIRVTKVFTTRLHDAEFVCSSRGTAFNHQW